MTPQDISKELSRIISASHQRPIKATEADLMRLKNKIDNSLFLTPYKTEEEYGRT